MDDFGRQLFCTLRAMWKHRWLGLLVAWSVAAVGVAIVLSIPEKYLAVARIYVNTQSILKPLMAELAVQPNLDQQVEILSQTLKSRPNIEKLNRLVDQDWDSKPRRLQDGLIDWTIRHLEIKGAAEDNLYTLTYIDADPAKAKHVVEATVSVFSETRLGENRKDSTAAQRFIENQIAVYEKKLQEAERQLKEFRLRHVDTLSEDGKSGGDQLSGVSAQLADAKLELREAENARDAIRRMMLGEDPGSPRHGVLEGAPGILVSGIDGRIQAQKSNLDTLLQHYTEEHPDVISARRLIRELEEQRRLEIAERRKNAAVAPASIALSNDLGYQQLKEAYGKADARVASLRARVDDYESRHKRILMGLKAQPEIEAEFARLNRDYQIHKKDYQALVERRESAALSGELNSTRGVDDFRLIDPPRVSHRPVAPNRLLLLFLVLLLALAVGGFASFAAHQVRPVFFEAHSLREVSGLPLLGCISEADGERRIELERSDLRRFLFAFGGLVVPYSVGLLVFFSLLRNKV